MNMMEQQQQQQPLQILPDCFYPTTPTLIPPTSKTPSHSLPLSNLDDQNFLRFSIKYLYLFRTSVAVDRLKCSLARALVDYYPLAGRLTPCPDDHRKLQVDCNAAGAVFAEAFMDLTADEFIQLSGKPNRSWRKLLYKVEAPTFLHIPPLVVQVTKLRCGGMIVCTGVNHCLCDGIGTAQFLHVWAHFARDDVDSLITPFHSRHVFNPRERESHKLTSFHPAFSRSAPGGYCNSHSALDVTRYLQSQPLTPASLTFSQSQILRLKSQCAPPLKCTSFEALAAHTWRCWAKSLDLPPSLAVKLLFSVNIRKRVEPELPAGYYGNGFVLGCAEAPVKDLAGGGSGANLHDAVRLIQRAKLALTDDYVRSAVDLLEDKSVTTDLSSSLVISQWSKLGLEDLDFGEGKPLFMGPLTSDIYCLFVPLVGDPNAARVLVSLPQQIVGKFEYYMTEFLDSKPNEGTINGHLEVENLEMVLA
ncbi:PREDICTED: omega-hydroxypalmitate O-feruloyl transferase [Ipomoea nil]|uniref:omega-hydroxypalmitate O-feruloyl transferase n=1 Tax=Ipomoea nil TaxID=35883 RepID=UPI0009016789|nr:PREDICTED: omega-hydroxypalmitate O-feruloyl transferase [Ipomoea nil]